MENNLKKNMYIYVCTYICIYLSIYNKCIYFSIYILSLYIFINIYKYIFCQYIFDNLVNQLYFKKNLKTNPYYGEAIEEGHNQSWTIKQCTRRHYLEPKERGKLEPAL